MKNILLSILIISGLTITSRAASLPEYTIKAAYLYNFALLTTWPNSQNKEEVQICVYGENGFNEELDALEEKSIGEQVLKIHKINTAEEAKACQIIFVGEVDISKEKQLVDSISNLPILVVTDNPEVMNNHILIIRDNKRLAFDIRLKRVHDINLIMSSRLLKLARNVKQ